MPRGNNIGKLVPEGYWTKQQLADRLGINVSTLKRWIASGKVTVAEWMRYGELDVMLFDAQSLKEAQENTGWHQ